MFFADFSRADARKKRLQFRTERTRQLLESFSANTDDDESDGMQLDQQQSQSKINQ